MTFNRAGLLLTHSFIFTNVPYRIKAATMIIHLVMSFPAIFVGIMCRTKEEIDLSMLIAVLMYLKEHASCIYGTASGRRNIKIRNRQQIPRSPAIILIAV